MISRAALVLAWENLNAWNVTAASTMNVLFWLAVPDVLITWMRLFATFVIHQRLSVRVLLLEPELVQD